MKKKKSLRRFLRYLYLKIIRINDSPEKIAKSVAFGVFIGIFPTFGFGGIISIVFAKIFELNYLATFLGTFIMNYFTSPIFWSLSYFLGSLILEGEIDFRIIERGKIKYFALKYTLGNILVSLFFSLITYYITKTLILNYKKRKERNKKILS